MLIMLPSPCGVFVPCFGVVSGRTAPEPPSAEDATAIEGRASRQGCDGLMRHDYSRDRLRSCEVSCFCGVFAVSASYCTRGTYASSLVRFYTSRSLGARHLRACPVREVVTIAWDPHPRAPVEGVLWAEGVLESQTL
ncbi:hypothetical protein Taro_010000 [Colocasia esculenta]|uniref:Uncharacterized protein n=1 Tax=Colocasia esculenta TaxID=4460 RepID=A0A843U1U5_COLES|nr:hypothetical protein [Colocasia esculenta]